MGRAPAQRRGGGAQGANAHAQAPHPHCRRGGASTPPPTDAQTVCDGACEIGPIAQDDRTDEARRLRLEAAYCPHTDPCCQPGAAGQGYPTCEHPCNGDEAHYHQNTHPDPGNPVADIPNPFAGQYIASFTKGLPHDPQTGLGAPVVYCRLLQALATGDPADFEAVRPLGCEPANAAPPNPLPPGQRRLENPQAAFAYELEGADSHALYMPPAPRFASEQEAAEIAENYWMALTRDVPFPRYATDPLLQQAAGDLDNLFAQDLSPYLQQPITPANVFRGPTQGDRTGPYLSQFLLLDVPYGAQLIPAAIRTLVPGVDFLTDWDGWLAVQNGCDAAQSNCEQGRRLIRSGRDLSQFVHVDRDFNAFLNACALLLEGREPLRRCEAQPGLGVPFGPCLPYPNAQAPPAEEFPGKSANQLGLGTFGDQHVKSLVVGATFRAFHAVWYQKWSVHRRLRPEEFGGRVHLAKLNQRGIAGGQPFPVNPLLFQSVALFGPNAAGGAAGGLIFAHNQGQNANLNTPPQNRLGRPSKEGTYLLPMVYAEGSPLHPSYGSGHSTVAGCLATLLKAFFHNDWVFPSPVEANEDGTALRPAIDPAIGLPYRLTVAGELDKLASNIGLGRVWAGVHWRSDHEESMLLGEQMAISILCNQRHTFNERFEFRFRSFDFGPYGGQVVRIRPAAARWDGPDDECAACVELLPPDQYGAACARRRRP